MKWIMRIFKWIIILLIIVVIGLVIAGRRPGHGHFETSVLINRPATVVFAALSDPEKMYSKWISGDIDVKILTPGKIGAGTKILLTENINGRRVMMEEEITALNPPYLEKYTTIGKGDDKFTEQGEYRLKEKDGQTEFTLVSQMEYQGWLFNLLEPVITPTVKHKFAGDQLTLKRILEAH